MFFSKDPERMYLEQKGRNAKKQPVKQPAFPGAGTRKTKRAIRRLPAGMLAALLVFVLTIPAATAAASDTAAAAAEAAEAEAAETAAASDTAETAAASDTAAAAAEAAEAEPAEAAAASDTAAAAAEAAEAEPVLRIHLAGEPGDPVPSAVMDADTASLLKLISEGLTVLDENGEAAPGCAGSWKVSEDGLEWTFRLRKNLCWSDGEPLKADDFVKLFRKTADPASEVLYGHHLMRNLEGYEDMLNGDSEALGVSAEGSRTLVVRLRSPDPDFARTCASWALLPVRGEIREDEAAPESPGHEDTEKDDDTENPEHEDAEKDGDTENPEHEDTEKDDDTETADSADNTQDSMQTSASAWETVIGNGPYVITSCVPGQEYLLERNPNYHAEEKTPFDTVLWMVSGDSNEEFSAFLNKEFSAMSQIPAEEEAELAASAETDAAVSREHTDLTAAGPPEPASAAADTAALYEQTIVPDTLGILFNCGKEALEDPLVRRALSAAVDRTYIAEEILCNAYVPAADTAGSLHTEGGADPLRAEGTADPFRAEGAADPLRAEDIAGSLRIEGNTAEAKDLLAEAGYPEGEGFPVLTCLANEKDISSLLAEYLATVWKDLGIDVRVETEDVKDLAQEKTAGTYDIVCGSLFLASDLPAAELSAFVSDSTENVSAFSSEAYDSLLEKAMASADPGEYKDCLQKAAEILQEELPFAPLAMRRVSWLRQEDCAGIFCDSSGCWQLWKTTEQDTDPETDPEKDDPQNDPEKDDPQNDPEKDDPEKDDPESNANAARSILSTAGFNVEGTKNSARGSKTNTRGIRNNSKGSSPAGGISWLEARTKNTASSASNNAASGGAASGNTAAQESDSYLLRILHSDKYFEKADTTAYLTRQAWVLDKTGADAMGLVSLPKYTEVHLTGTGNANYARITMDGRFRYLGADRVTTDPSALKKVNALEKEQALQMKTAAASLHGLKESELAGHAADIHAENERIRKEIAHHEMIKTQTRNPNWNGPVLSRSRGSVIGPSGKETYYNLNMSGVVNIMRRMGNTDEYWVRDDGCKMLGDYIMCAANLRVHPRGSLVECSLGTCIVCDTGGFASRNAHQLDIAVTW